MFLYFAQGWPRTDLVIDTVHRCQWADITTLLWEIAMDANILETDCLQVFTERSADLLLVSHPKPCKLVVMQYFENDCIDVAALYL